MMFAGNTDGVNKTRDCWQVRPTVVEVNLTSNGLEFVVSLGPPTIFVVVVALVK